LEELYHGKVSPDEKVVSTDPKYRSIHRKISESISIWKEKLTDEDFNELEALLDLYHQACGMNMTASFASGFKLGTLIMIEVLSGDGE
jgi:uncharacterized protein (UPF0335 family)